MVDLFPGFDAIYLIPIFFLGTIIFGIARIAYLRGKIYCRLYGEDNVTRHSWRKSGKDNLIKLKGSAGPGDYKVRPDAFTQEKGILFWIPRVLTWDEGHIEPRVKGSIRESGHPTPEQLKILRSSRYIRESYRRQIDPWVWIAIVAILMLGMVIIYLIGVIPTPGG